jgi:hypothetical protein
MKTNQISTNIYVAEDPNFGEYNKEVVNRLLQQVQIDFSSWIGNEVFSTSNCFLFYQDECPEIYSLGETGHRICLCVKGDDWWRWVYQFAHEYCHHLINGTMSGEVTGLMWFEETICNLSSIYHLDRLIALYDVLRIDNHYKDIVVHFYNLSLGTAQSNCQEYLKLHMDELVEPVYHREIYSNLSATMLPLFLENTHLWKIILHFGDMRSWNSLEDLFAHLRETADDSYSVSLDKLYNMLCCTSDCE